MTDKVRPGRECACGEDRAAMMKRDRRRPDGLATRCRACARARNAAYRAANPDYDRDYRTNNHDRVRAAVRTRRARLSARTDAELAADRAAARPDGMKRCRAGHMAPVGEFYTNRSRHDGLGDYCRPCNNARVIEHRRGRRLQWWAEHGVKLACVYCGGDWEHADHVVSLAGGGADELWALRPACAACNLSKNDRPPLEWLATRLLPYSDELAAVSITLSMLGELDEDIPPVWSTDWVEAARLP